MRESICAAAYPSHRVICCRAVQTTRPLLDKSDRNPNPVTQRWRRIPTRVYIENDTELQR
jgi:hypothetical protein